MISFLYPTACAIVSIGGSVFGIAIARLQCAAVMGATARNMAPCRRCTCASKGFLRVMVSATALVYTCGNGENGHRKKGACVAQKARGKDSHRACRADTQPRGALACLHARRRRRFLVRGEESERGAAVYYDRPLGRRYFRRLGRA